jgi:glycosyltransferase involved in cell wall biosynthesis
MLPNLAIVVVTYNRVAVLLETLHRLREYVRYNGEIKYCIADDGSTDGTQPMIGEWLPDATDIGIVQSNRVGLGANTNAGLLAAWEYSPIVLQLQDDMQLQSPLNLDAHVQKLVDDESAGFIRLWGVAGHQYNATLDGGYWRIAWDSPEHYIASDRPHIKHRRFHDAAGMYPTGKTTGDTEEAWCHQTRLVSQEKTIPSVLVPLIDTENSWKHVCYDQRWRDKGL